MTNRAAGRNLVVPKSKLLLVVGAGASVEFEMPTVSMVRDIINNAAQRAYPLAEQPRTNLYEHIEGMVTRYWENTVPAHLRRKPNFEDVLYTVFALAAAFPAGVDTSALGAVIEPRQLPDVVFFGRKRERVDQDVFRNFGNSAVDTLLCAFRDQCKVIERHKKNEFARLISLMNALQAEFDIAVATLNYDNIVYRALPGIETGFDPKTGRFHARRIFERLAWPCMLHLHGSVHFDMPLPKTGDMHEIHWQSDINAEFAQNAAGRSARANREGAYFPTSAIVAGYGKTTQILRQPFRTYYSEPDRLVARCDAVLFAGYGFGDAHLNIGFEQFRDNRRRKVAIIGHAENDAMTISGADLGDDNPLITTILSTFKTDYRHMRWLGHNAPATVEALKRAQEFEICSKPGTPLAFWYNGLLSACDNAGKVIAQLR
jgi:hypothetical protein